MRIDNNGGGGGDADLYESYKKIKKQKAQFEQCLLWKWTLHKDNHLQTGNGFDIIKKMLVYSLSLEYEEEPDYTYCIYEL